MSSPITLVDNAIETAKRAIQFDEQGETNIAIYYYEASSRLLSQAALIADSTKAESLNGKAIQYKNRANELKNKTLEEHMIDETVNDRKTKLKQCYFLFQQAIEEDEQGDKDDAIELYAKAVEYVTENSELMQGELKRIALQALERAEELKGWYKSACAFDSDNHDYIV